jgi:hypothetical protein
MNISALNAADRNIVILGAIVVVTGLLSFLDPSGSWGAVVVLGILGGLLAGFVSLQAQVAPTVKLPAARGMVLLIAGLLAAGGFVLAGLTYLGYVFSIRIFSIIFDAGLVASLVLLWLGWQAYQKEQGSTGTAAPPPGA